MRLATVANNFLSGDSSQSAQIIHRAVPRFYTNFKVNFNGKEVFVIILGI